MGTPSLADGGRPDRGSSQTIRTTDAERRLRKTQAEAQRHRATLEAIYAGGWWRLRAVVRRFTAPLRAVRARFRR